jgi:hypothetical protein
MDENTRGRTIRKGRREFKDAVTGMPVRYLKCRTYLHWWNDDLSEGATVIEITARTVTILVNCLRCGAHKPVDIRRSGPNAGERTRVGGYQYPDGYQFDFRLTQVERQAIYAIVAETIAEQAFQLELTELIETTDTASS